MTLGRLFSILGGVAAVVLAGTCAGLYWVAAHNAREESSASARLVAEATARNLAGVLAMSGGVLDQLAQEPELAEALASGDPARIFTAEERLTRLVPGAALVRLVPGAIEAPDENRNPRMGFADLDMVRQTGTGKPVPAVHAANTPDAHIALARRLSQGDGVILASLAPKLIGAGMPAGLAKIGMELKQQSLSLGFSGDAALKQNAPDGEVPIPGTAWTLSYWGPPSADPGGIWFLSLSAMAILLTAGGGYFAHRWTAGALRHDHDNLVLVVKDLLSRREMREYPLRFEEMRRFALQLEPLQGLVLDLILEHRSKSPAAEQGIDPDRPLDSFREPARAMPPASPVPVGPSVAVSPGIFRAYDIRGVVGETLTPEVVRLIGHAIGSEVRDRGEYTVAVARDGRLSSPDLGQALTQGLLASGCTVIDLGLVPTPVLYFATNVLNTESGVMVTGSHNPANYNGLKIVIAGETLAGKDIQKLRTRVERNDFLDGQGQLEFRSLVPDYLERIIHDVQLGRSMKVVVDCGNGAAGGIAPALLEELGCEVVPLFCEVDGNFPNHHPDPGNPKNLETLIRTVLEHGADLGVAFDGDGDRLGVVDSSGKVIWPDRQLMMLAADVLSREPGSDVIFDVKCTRHLASYIVRHGGRPLMWKTGHSLIKAKIRETGAMLAGEMSGHIFFKERWYGFDDGLYACARLLEVLSLDPRPTAELFAELPDGVNTPELTIDVKEGENVQLVARLREIADFPEARVTDIDGLRVDFADGWGLVRASNTTPSLVLRFEADTPDSLIRIMGEFKSLLKKVKPDIAFPLITV
jgi:phosphomannomutase/phosphoglucomutase